MKTVTLSVLMIILACLFDQKAMADDVDDLYLQFISFVPDHVEISGFIVVDYLKDNPRVLQIEAEGGVIAVRFFAALVATFDRIEIDEKRLHGAAGGPGLALKFSKGKKSADIMLSGIARLVIENPAHPRAFDLQPDQHGHAFIPKLTDSLMLDLHGNQKVWSRVVTKKPKPDIPGKAEG